MQNSSSFIWNHHVTCRIKNEDRSSIRTAKTTCFSPPKRSIYFLCIASNEFLSNSCLRLRSTSTYGFQCCCHGEFEAWSYRLTIYWIIYLAKNHVQACKSLDFFCFFFFRFSSLVSVLASKRFDCRERISSNFVFASLKSASDLEAINCWYIGRATPKN